MNEWQQKALGGIPHGAEGLRQPDGAFVCEGWTCATNGKTLLAIPGEHVEEEWENAASIVRKYIAEPDKPERTYRTTVEAVREFAGEPTPACPDCTEEERGQACGQCKGSGEVECECVGCGDLHFTICRECDGERGHYCGTCDNEGVISLYEFEGRVTRLGDHEFNRGLWAWLLKDIPDGPITIALPKSDHGAARVDGDGWAGLVMPLRQLGGPRPSDPLPATEVLEVTS